MGDIVTATMMIIISKFINHRQKMMIIISKFMNHRQKLGNIEFCLFVYNISWRITYCEFLLSVITACVK